MIKGTYDSSGLEALKRKYEAAIILWPMYHREIVFKIANDIVANTQMRTPVDTGRLRQNWRIGEILQDADSIIIEIYNNTEYASHVEFGHRQEVGRFVPAIGKRLVKPKVEGKFMFTKSMNEASREMEERLQREFKEFWENLQV